MEYKECLGFIPKKEYKKIRKLSQKQLLKYYVLEEKGLHYLPCRIFVTIRCIAKAQDFILSVYNKNTKTFFKHKSMNYFDEDHVLKIVTKEFLENLIEQYRQGIAEEYHFSIKSFAPEDTGFGNVFKSVEKEDFDFSKITQNQINALNKMIFKAMYLHDNWGNKSFYSLDDKTIYLTNETSEHEIFQLINLYKTFNWEKNIMVYHAR